MKKNVETRCILVLYTGTEITKIGLNELGKLLVTHASARNDMEVFTNDSEQLAQIILQGTSFAERASIISLTPQTTPEDNAVIFIGELFSDALRESLNVPFALKLAETLNKARSNPDDEMSNRLVKACDILSKEDLCISESLLKKYRMNTDRLNIIKQLNGCI